MSNDQTQTTEPCLRLVDRLRGIYTIPVNDGAGPLNGKMTFTAPEPYPTTPIKLEAAARIEKLEAVADAARLALKAFLYPESFPTGESGIYRRQLRDALDVLDSKDA